MSTDKNSTLCYTFFKEIDYSDTYVRSCVPFVNVERKYIIEYKKPKLATRANLPMILIQITDDGYDILNVYSQSNNHKKKCYKSSLRIMLDKIIPQLKT